MANKAIIGFIIFVLLLGCLFFAAINAGYRFNYSKSLPIGIYKIDIFSKKIERNRIMAFCPPDVEIVNIFSKNGYIEKGACSVGTVPLLKKIIAIPGDNIKITENSVFVNGREIKNSALLGHMPKTMLGNHLVKAGEVWFLSDYNINSFDSRYYGAVPIVNIIAGAKPIFTF